jgi:hypothetical protein
MSADEQKRCFDCDFWCGRCSMVRGVHFASSNACGAFVQKKLGDYVR